MIGVGGPGIAGAVLVWGAFSGAWRDDEAMTRRKKIYEGKAKILYEGPEPGTLIQYFKDDATAFNARRRRCSRARASSTTASASTS